MPEAVLFFVFGALALTGALGVVLARAAPDLGVDLLLDVLRGGTVAQHSHQVAERRRPVLAVDLSQRVGVTAPHPRRKPQLRPLRTAAHRTVRGLPRNGHGHMTWSH